MQRLSNYPILYSPTPGEANFAFSPISTLSEVSDYLGLISLSTEKKFLGAVPITPNFGLLANLEKSLTWLIGTF